MERTRQACDRNAVAFGAAVAHAAAHQSSSASDDVPDFRGGDWRDYLLGRTFGALTIYAGRCVQKRRHRAFIYVMAGLNCPLISGGTLLGVATFMLRQTPVARREFGVSPANRC